MKILFYTGGDEFTSPRETVDDDKSDASTLTFKDTSIAHVERDDQNNWTIYTKGQHFYITMTAEDVENIVRLAEIKRPVLDVYRRGEDQPACESEMDKYDATGNPLLYGSQVMIDDKPYTIFVDLDPK
jgi:hypothetical protein